jgi:hypothetical protein
MTLTKTAISQKRRWPQCKDKKLILLKDLVFRVDAIYSMIGNMLELPKDEDTPEKVQLLIVNN